MGPDQHRAQQALQRVLTGDQSGAVSLQGDEIVLDVDEVISQVKERLVARGLTIVENVPIPETDKQIVLMEAPRVRQTAHDLRVQQPGGQVGAPLRGCPVRGGPAAGSPTRPRMAVWIGALVAANALLLAFVLSVGRQLFIDALAGTTFGPASKVFYNTLLNYLERGQEVVLWLGLIIVVAGVYAGANRMGTAVRTTLSGGLEQIGGKLAGTGLGGITGVGRWVASNAGWLRVVVVALGAVVLLWGNNVTTDRLWWSLALVLVLLALVQVFVGAGRYKDRPGRLDPGLATT